MDGLRHRIGGLEKLSGKGSVSTDSANHEQMVKYRKEKVERVANRIPNQEVEGAENADLLVVGWGGTEGALRCAVQELQAEGKSIAFTQFNYIMPLPKNTEELLKRYKKVVVCELNMGQFVNYLRMNFQGMMFHQYNKVQGLPFEVSELKEVFNQILGE
jgi:2-oxoglutarate ferredoxin oxidoreductase subunit alpha